MLVFEKKGKLEYPEKNLLVQSRKPTATQPTLWRRVWESNPEAALVGGECSHHYTIPVPPSELNSK